MHICVVHMLCSQVYGLPLLGQPHQTIIIISRNIRRRPAVLRRFNRDWKEAASDGRLAAERREA